ncbi:hypothetical protein Poli38472_001285 [Pythium oligandrum]|uniref:Uncharacterized protein n=1 Tax=Pythium oligandrum TaxID=41045 RepID=A0A8K1CT81_PYTOL|nr:hypothetical protein Poli38472_001285 [Pythium oligandrum]|eukprot:TMW69129.1 hypothetical protein Poli38472_001285 [Pythium oligandrum]
MPAGDKRSHEDMAADKRPGEDAQGGNAGLAAGMLGLPFMLPSAALMAMNSVQQQEQGEDGGAAAALALQATRVEGEDKTGEQAQLQQQLLQQQLQLFQQQQQQLSTMSQSDLSAMATMAQQMALGMVMMPMMPLMMMNQNGQNGQNSPQEGQGSPGRNGSTEFSHAAAAESLGLVAQAGQDAAAALPMMAAANFGIGNDETPKRKRGRPPKKDVMTRGKPDGDKALKQFPMWGYGMPLPFLPGFMPPNGAAGSDQSGAASQDDGTVKEGEDEAGRPGKAGGAKKKTRGTGKPRGRPRTRPRPGEIIQRVKPPPIAPANFPGMQEYLAQRMAEWKATQTGTPGSGEENRLGSLGASLLPGDHE